MEKKTKGKKRLIIDPLQNMSRVSMAFIVAFQLMLTSYSHGQTQCDSLVLEFRQLILSEIAENNGLVTWEDETRESHCLVMLNCASSDLQLRTNDSVPAIRSEMFLGLAQKSSDLNLLSNILKNHQGDSAEYVSMSTDVVDVWTVEEFMKMVFNAKSSNSLNIVDFEARLKKLRSAPRIIIPGLKNGIISKDSILQLDRLVCSMEGVGILSFTMNTGKEMRSNSDLLTKQMKRRLKNLNHGDKVYFEDLTVSMPDGTTRKLSPISVTVE